MHICRKLHRYQGRPTSNSSTQPNPERARHIRKTNHPRPADRFKLQKTTSKILKLTWSPNITRISTIAHITLYGWRLRSRGGWLEGRGLGWRRIRARRQQPGRVQLRRLRLCGSRSQLPGCARLWSVHLCSRSWKMRLRLQATPQAQLAASPPLRLLPLTSRLLRRARRTPAQSAHLLWAWKMVKQALGSGQETCQPRSAAG